MKERVNKTAIIEAIVPNLLLVCLSFFWKSLLLTAFIRFFFGCSSSGSETSGSLSSSSSSSESLSNIAEPSKSLSSSNDMEPSSSLLSSSSLQFQAHMRMNKICRSAQKHYRMTEILLTHHHRLAHVSFHYRHHHRHHRRYRHRPNLHRFHHPFHYQSHP